MAKKRTVEASTAVIKTSSVEVIVEDTSAHPLCLHGPTLLFRNEKERYFACSLCRNKKDCTILISEKDWHKESVKNRNEKYLEMMPTLDKSAVFKTLIEVKSEHASNRAYCHTCQELYIISQKKSHSQDHHVVTPLTDEQLMKPTSWLLPLENDTAEAQYLFSKNSIAVILRTLLQNKISNIICIGTPTIHEAASSNSTFQSILLDFDKRQAQFHKPEDFIWYNMFNNYLFNGMEDEKLLKRFLKNSSTYAMCFLCVLHIADNTANELRDGGICIVMDPPFGGRTEPLVQTIRDLTETYNHVNPKAKLDNLPVIWAFPYFSEPYIVNSMQDMKMHDYQVEYENHSKFHNKNTKGRKFGSPVRLFTNLSLSTIDLSHNPRYKHCDKCKYYVSLTNVHCNKCNACTSKNGMSYRHCKLCQKCVKPTYVHCKACGRCSLGKGHVCGLVVESQSCFNCKTRGHKKVECPLLTNGPTSKKRKQA